MLVYQDAEQKQMYPKVMLFQSRQMNSKVYQNVKSVHLLCIIWIFIHLESILDQTCTIQDIVQSQKGVITAT